MTEFRTSLDRREALAWGGLALGGLAVAPLWWPQPAQAALGLGNLLGNASDNALDKLSQKDAFYNDLAIRILLPGSKGKLARSLLKAGDKLGVTTKLTRSLNDAGSLAAQEAKPIFRDAIKGIKLTDVPGIATQKDGASQYLKRSAGVALGGKVRPLIVSALDKVGAFKQLEQLNSSKGLLGQFASLTKLNRDSLSDSVTDQAMNGIFSYMGKEEAGLRGKVGNIGDLLGGIIK